jgi:hypothetical protein
MATAVQFAGKEIEAKAWVAATQAAANTVMAFFHEHSDFDALD